MEKSPSWSRAHDWKSCKPARVSRVRISPSPPDKNPESPVLSGLLFYAQAPCLSKNKQYFHANKCTKNVRIGKNLSQSLVNRNPPRSTKLPGGFPCARIGHLRIKQLLLRSPSPRQPCDGQAPALVIERGLGGDLRRHAALA